MGAKEYRMFYWSSKNIHVVLSDAEEINLVRELSGEDGADVFAYDTRIETRKKYEKLIISTLKTSLRENKDKFISKYVHRSLTGEQIHDFFRGYLSRYGQLTKNATFGKFVNDTHNPDIFGAERLMKVALGIQEENPIYYVTFVNRKWIPLPRYNYDSYLSFPKDSVIKMVGSVTNFILITDKFSLNFNEKNLSIKII